MNFIGVAWNAATIAGQYFKLIFAGVGCVSLPVCCDEWMNMQWQVSAANPLLSSSDTPDSPFHFLSPQIVDTKLHV